MQDFGSIGELIADIATIATLICLARQVQAHTNATQTASRWEKMGRPLYIPKVVAVVDKRVAQGNFLDVRKLSNGNLDDSGSE
jgi:hypothetical protein